MKKLKVTFYNYLVIKIVNFKIVNVYLTLIKLRVKKEFFK